MAITISDELDNRLHEKPYLKPGANYLLYPNDLLLDY